MKLDNQIPVWDIFIRIFHWSLALLIFLAYVTADEKEFLHRYIGYSVFGLVISRLIWGFIGTKYALFCNFICSPGKGVTYIKELISGKPKYYEGHNPAAAWMIIFFLICSMVICFSGYMAYASKEMNFSLGFDASSLSVTNVYADDHKREGHGYKHKQKERHGEDEWEDRKGDGFWCELHEASAQAMIFLIVLHVIGVAISSWLHNENLIKSMITGKKTAHIP
jgi:cytochrome b